MQLKTSNITLQQDSRVKVQQTTLFMPFMLCTVHHILSPMPSASQPLIIRDNKHRPYRKPKASSSLSIMSLTTEDGNQPTQPLTLFLLGSNRNTDRREQELFPSNRKEPTTSLVLPAKGGYCGFSRVPPRKYDSIPLPPFKFLTNQQT